VVKVATFAKRQTVVLHARKAKKEMFANKEIES